MQFQGFKPEAQKRIAGKLGYTGDMSNFNGYLQQNPEANNKMNMYNQQAVMMMQGGMVRKNFAEGGYAGPVGTAPTFIRSIVSFLICGTVLCSSTGPP